MGTQAIVTNPHGKSAVFTLQINKGGHSWLDLKKNWEVVDCPQTRAALVESSLEKE